MWENCGCTLTDLQDCLEDTFENNNIINNCHSNRVCAVVFFRKGLPLLAGLVATIPEANQQAAKSGVESLKMHTHSFTRFFGGRAHTY